MASPRGTAFAAGAEDPETRRTGRAARHHRRPALLLAAAGSAPRQRGADAARVPAVRPPARPWDRLADSAGRDRASEASLARAVAARCRAALHAVSSSSHRHQKGRGRSL